MKIWIDDMRTAPVGKIDMRRIIKRNGWREIV